MLVVLGQQYQLEILECVIFRMVVFLMLADRCA